MYVDLSQFIDVGSANRMTVNILCLSFSASLVSYCELGTHFGNIQH